MPSSDTSLPRVAATCSSGLFRQSVRTFEPAGGPPPPPVTETTDRFGHRYRIVGDEVVVDHRTGGAYSLKERTPLPVAELTCLAATPEGDLWIGTQRGALRWTRGCIEYYASKRWLPADEVLAVEALADGGARLWTPAGVSLIQFPEFTLTDKARHYETLTDARHKRFGYVTGCRLIRPGDLTESEPNIDDNDGLWTAMYVAAESFRYAVTGSAVARKNARESLQAILELERKTPLPGFPARALTHRTESDFGRERGGEWHPTDDGEWEWKGDTSSDELDGHYFAWPIYYDLVADESDKEQIRRVCTRVTDHLLDHGYYLVDLDGQPTRWGVWAPERLNDDPQWRAERGLNSLEILSYLKVAHHLTGTRRYADAYRDLIANHHYALNMIDQKVLPGDFPGAENNHSDDELAFLAYHGLLRYETDPELRALYGASLERSFEIERPEHCPLWNFLYGALTGRPCDAEAGVTALQEIPLDLIEWTIVNSHRLDLPRDPDWGRHGEPQAAVPIPWRERRMHKWNGNPYELDGGNDRTEECGTFWLLPYYLGLYYRLVTG